MVVNYSEWPFNIPTLSITRSSIIYPNRDYWLENIPCGNPASFYQNCKGCSAIHTYVANCSESHTFFFKKNYYPKPLWDSISRPIAQISSVAGGDNTTGTPRKGSLGMYMATYIHS
jgi:hypothetical protein